MSRRRQDDFDDGYDDNFDDDAFLDDEELEPERIQRRRDPRQSARPKRPRDRTDDKHNRHRDLASLKAWGAPY